MSDKSKNILLGVLIVGLVSMTVAYAALSTTLTINGTASIPATKWDIQITDWTDTTPTSITKGNKTMVNTAEHPAATTSATAITNLAVQLKQPGDKATYSFNISNLGSIDAKLASFVYHCKVGTGESATACDNTVLRYQISCDPAATTSGQVLAKASDITDASTATKAHCTLEVEYLDKATSGEGQTYSQDAINANLDATWVYEQN